MEKTEVEPETEEFTWERKPHPMCIPHIVDGILNYLSVPDLKSIRLVSSQYNEIACKTLQREETIVFRSIPQLETYVSKIKPISTAGNRRGGSYSSSLSLCSDLSALSTEYWEEDGERGRQYGEKNGTEDFEQERNGGLSRINCWPLNGQVDDNDSVSSFCPDDFDCYNFSQYRYSHRSFHFDYCDPSTELETIDHFFQTFGLDGEGNNENLQQQQNNDVDNNDNGDNEDFEEEEARQLEFLRQNPNRRPSFTPIVRSTLLRFMNSVSSTLRSLHICFPQSPRHPLHNFSFQQDMVELRFLALGYYAGCSRVLDHLPALKKLELWNVQFRDCHGIGKVVPDKYQGITSVIS